MEDFDFSSLQNGGEAGGFDYASQAVQAMDAVMTTIAEVKSAKANYEDLVRQHKAYLQQCRSQEEIAKMQSWIDYYQTIVDLLDEVIEKREKIDKKNNTKRVLIFGGAISVAVLLTYLAVKR